MDDSSAAVCQLVHEVRKARGLLHKNITAGVLPAPIAELILGLLVNVLDTARQIYDASVADQGTADRGTAEQLTQLARRMEWERDRARVAIELSAHLPRHYLTEVAESALVTAETFFAVWREYVRGCRTAA